MNVLPIVLLSILFIGLICSVLFIISIVSSQGSREGIDYFIVGNLGTGFLVLSITWIIMQFNILYGAINSVCAVYGFLTVFAILLILLAIVGIAFIHNYEIGYKNSHISLSEIGIGCLFAWTFALLWALWSVNFFQSKEMMLPPSSVYCLGFTSKSALYSISSVLFLCPIIVGILFNGVQEQMVNYLINMRHSNAASDKLKARKHFLKHKEIVKNHLVCIVASLAFCAIPAIVWTQLLTFALHPVELDFFIAILIALLPLGTSASFLLSDGQSKIALKNIFGASEAIKQCY